MPLPAVIHCTSPAPSVPRLPRLSPCSTGAGEHVGDRFDAAMRMPREAGEIVVRVVVAEVVEQQERIESVVSPNPNARCSFTPAPSIVGCWNAPFDGANGHCLLSLPTLRQE